MATPLLPLYGYCTPSHEILRDEWFLPSVRRWNEFDVRVINGEQLPDGATYKSKDWGRGMQSKVRAILRAIEECSGGVFVFSDMDIQYLRPSKDYLLAAIRNCDIAFQRNKPNGELCTGFFVCRANDATRALWSSILEALEKDPSKDDQDCAQELLQRRSRLGMLFHFAGLFFLRSIGALSAVAFRAPGSALRWKLLGPDVYLPGSMWTPGMPLRIPKAILIHHANWTIGIDNKIAELRYVRETVESWK